MTTIEARKPIPSQKYYIKERHNPQFGVYYVKMGQLSARRAKQSENSIYGENYMLGFDNESAYQTAIANLVAKGEKVQ